jgi:hypothetical protein
LYTSGADNVGGNKPNHPHFKAVGPIFSLSASLMTTSVAQLILPLVSKQSPDNPEINKNWGWG